jgi:hypothetical protein
MAKVGTRELIGSRGKVNMGCDGLLSNRMDDSVDSVDSTSPGIWIRRNQMPVETRCPRMRLATKTRDFVENLSEESCCYALEM